MSFSPVQQRRAQPAVSSVQQRAICYPTTITNHRRHHYHSNTITTATSMGVVVVVVVVEVVQVFPANNRFGPLSGDRS